MCGVCGKPAAYFARDNTTLHFACADGSHCTDRSLDWKSVNAVGGALLAAAETAAAIKKDLGY